MRIQNMTGRSGDPIKNQFIITTDKGKLFQSYDSAIALIEPCGQVHLSKHWDYSTTTGKYRNMFLGETKKETQRKIDSGEYLTDLSIDGDLEVTQ